jgi:hypothetical protein
MKNGFQLFIAAKSFACVNVAATNQNASCKRNGIRRARFAPLALLGLAMLAPKGVAF